MKKIQFYLITFLLLSTLNMQQLLGGFSSADANDCAEPLLTFLKSFGYGETTFFQYEIKKCQKQVVAGMNFEMELLIFEQTCKITLYRNLQNEITLNQNKENSCFEFEEEQEDAVSN